MKKLFYLLLFFSIHATLLTFTTSCSEKEEVGEYDNWPSRNVAYIDSIAKVCAANADGSWMKICAFNLNDSIEALAPNNAHYIYVQKLEKGADTYKPLYNDSVRVHYMGRLIPSAKYPQGRIFDKSYSTYTFNEATDVPSLLGVSKVVTGFTTALMNMVEGDRWRVYIPSYLAYKSQDDANVPAHSTLVFDIKLARVYRYTIDKDTSWH